MCPKKPPIRPAFTLVELLVVIGIIALLIGILIPSLGRAREQASAVKCLANLHTTAQALVNYTADNKGTICPSFNMPAATGPTNYTAVGPSQAMDGWPCILERDGYLRSASRDQTSATVFYCPDTFDRYGMQNGQTGTDGGKARGYVEWPMMFDGSNGGGDSDNQAPVTMPAQGFNKIIRCSYWINSYNPIGAPGSSGPATLSTADLFYTVSVGWGPDATGIYTSPHRTSSIRYPSRLVIVADGVYMGRQGATQLINPTLTPQTNCRIGYRHRGSHGSNTTANAAFADGHAGPVDGFNFPQSKSASNPNAANNNNAMTVYANPDAIFGGG